MKPCSTAALAILALLAAPAAFAYSQSCAVTINSLQAQISAAKQAGNASKAAGLQKTLKQTKAKCSDEAQHTRAERKVRNGQKDVQKAQTELDQASEQLSDAQAHGNAEKIRNAQRNVVEKEGTLRQKIDDLRKARGDLKALKG